MEKLNEIGFTNFWGTTPAYNILKKENIIDIINLNENYGFDKKLDICSDNNNSSSCKYNLNILINNSNDIRHVIQTITETQNVINIDSNKNENCFSFQKLLKNIELNFYIYENNIENIARSIVFLYIIHDFNLNLKEKAEIFLEIYGNTLLSDKANSYLNNNYKNFVKILYNEKVINYKDSSVIGIIKAINSIINLSYLNYKEIDAIQDIFNSYDNKYSYTIEKFREDRARYLYKERYNYRENLIDWDFTMNTKKFVPYMGYNIYKQFRLTGISFENRLSNYKYPNKTLSSYIPGRSKSNKESIMVRGYWGDLVNSPYISFGVNLNTDEEEKYFKKTNQNYFIFNSKYISEYNILKAIYMLEYNSDYYNKFCSSDKLTDSNLEHGSILINTDNKNLELYSIKEQEHKDCVLYGFKLFNTKIHFISGDISKHLSKKKFINVFDYIIFGFHSKNIINDIDNNLKHKKISKIIFETPFYMTSFKDEDKENYKSTIKSRLKENNYILENSSFNGIWICKRPINNKTDVYN